MFCDLVGSTALSTQMDPEDLRDVITSFHSKCREAIQRYDGFIARYMGDGILVYFGYPQAHENDAERAARAGLDIVASMATLNAQVDTTHAVVLAVRVGVATGPVIVGDMIGEGAAEEAAVVGETPNLAARLQGVAQPDQLVISTATRRILDDLFTFDDLGTHNLKGIPQPVQAWQVTGAVDVEGRHEARRQMDSSPLVGREEELGLLLRAWDGACEGRGQVVFLQGEPGVGKSRLLEALREPLVDDSYTWLSIRCSPYHASTSLYPVIEHFKRVMHWQPEDDPSTLLAKLEVALRTQSSPLEEVVPLFAELMSLSIPEDSYPALSLSPRRKREATLDAIVGWALEITESKPVLQVWEDLHWADPTTLELLGLYIEQSPTASMLNVLTCRPDFSAPWPNRSHMTPITLNRLERPEVEAIVNNLTRGKALPDEVLEHIVAKADGVPLYVEELTKTILESAVLQEQSDRFLLDGTLAELQIPSTLQDSLMSRLDRVPALREVAQVAAVLGREFRYQMLELLADLDEKTLQEMLGQLVAEELLYQRGRPPRSRYIFKHALIQDAAYQSLLKRGRQAFHRRIAEMLESVYPELVAAQPELVAHHYGESGQAQEAFAYWTIAGTRAMDRWATGEAVKHFRAGLRMLEALPASAQRDRSELEIQTALGPALIASRGFGDPALLDTYRRAAQLCESAGDHEQICLMLRGQQIYHFALGDLEQSCDIARQLLTRADEAGNDDFKVGGSHALGQSLFIMGNHGHRHHGLCTIFDNWMAGRTARRAMPAVCWIRELDAWFSGPGP
jgi:class 3 adenylate cyclase